MTEDIQLNDRTIKVEEFREAWSFALMKRGLLVKLSIAAWSGKSTLKFEDLGIRFADADILKFMKKYVHLGTYKLFPPLVFSEIKAVIHRAKKNLDDHSFDTVWGKFVPWTALEMWERENKIIHDDFLQMVRNIGNEYDEIIRAVKREYFNMARDTWKRLYPESQDQPTEAFVTNFVNKIVAKIPTREDLLSRFKYETVYSVILMPSVLEGNIEKAKEIKRESENKDFTSRLEKQLKERLAEQYVQERKEYIDGFLNSTVMAMRGYVAELCDSVLQSMGRKALKKKLTDSHKTRLRKMIQKVRYLNFYDDNEISRLLNELETEMDKFKHEEDINLITNKLEEIVKTGADEYMPDNFNPLIGYLEP